MPTKKEENKDQNPLWLPEGSIRAIVFFMVMLVFCYMTIVRYIPVEAFIGVISVMVGYYFGKTSANGTIVALKEHIVTLARDNK